MFAVTTASSDNTLLTIAELRSAIGVSDNSKDADLTTLGARVAAQIYNVCNIAKDGATPPTLREETCSDTFREREFQEKIVLSRRPVTEIISITECDVALTEDQYELEPSSGIIKRLCNDRETLWYPGKIVVAYVAGYATVPDDLKLAASKFVQSIYRTGSRDPLLRSVTIEGVSTREYWVDPNNDSIVPGEVMDILNQGDYVEPVAG
jgi:hypothetical protein